MMQKILVVDDCMTDLHVTKSSLEKAGFSVTTARNGLEVKSKLVAQRPDLIVLDIVLPDRSGFEICRALKAEDMTREIPIILCSNKSSKMDKYWGLQQGANAYLPKPVDLEELLKTVKSLL